MRFEDWPERLKSALDIAEKETFQWGVNDCFYWTTEVIKNITGVDRARPHCAKKGVDVSSRPYMTQKGMDRILKNMGYENFFDLICDIYGKPKSIRRAKRGDLVMTEINGVDALGVCRGPDVMFKTRFENRFEPLFNCKCAWSID